MLKNKQLIIGILIGALVFGGIPVFAASQYILTQAQYKIVVSGVEYTDTEYPILNYNGTTYVPLRAVGKLLGNEPRWNEEKRQVEIGVTPEDLDLSQWIGIADAAKIHSIKIYLGKELILEKGGKKYTVPAPKTNKSEIQTLKDVSSDVAFSVIIYQNRTYIKINDLKAAGLI